MLKEFYDEIKDCQKCPLAKGRKNLVFGDGNPNAKIMFVGEAPGYYEDQQGRPFVGAAGKFLDELLNFIGLKRSDVYIANVLKCRPPENRDPRSEEIEACKPHLMKQIEIIKPNVVCTLGNFATQVILGKKVGISKVRAQHFSVGDLFVFPMFHPAAALHQDKLKDLCREDFKRLKAFLDLNLEPKPQKEQMSLF